MVMLLNNVAKKCAELSVGVIYRMLIQRCNNDHLQRD